MNEKLKNISLSIVLSFAIAFSWMQSLDTAAISQVDAGLKRALTSYAIARTLNAIISVAQGTEVSVQFGIGATFAPGQILDPVNDLIEQFGDLMLAASVAFGIMHIVIKISSFWMFSLLLTICASLWIFLRWRNIPAPEWISKALIVLLFVRFSIPVATAGNDWVFKQFMEPEFNQSLNVIQNNSNEISKTGNEITQINEGQDIGGGANAENMPVAAELSQAPSQGAELGVAPAQVQINAQSPEPIAAPTPAPVVEINRFSLAWFKRQTKKVEEKILPTVKATAHFVAEIPQAASNVVHMATSPRKTLADAKRAFETKLEKLKQSVDHLVEHLVKLIVVFVLQTIIIPLVLVWMLYRVSVGAYRSIHR